MIITRTPFRIPLGGGGTDLPSYYRQHEGFVLGAAISRYVYITVSRRPIDDRFWISYSQVEATDRVDEIRHGLVREALRMMGVNGGIEIHSIAEISSGTGMGSSGSFTVGLLNALHVYLRRPVTMHDLAEAAYRIEVERLGHPSGKQDQYMASCGGITSLYFDRDGRVRVEPLAMTSETFEDLENNLLLFSTGIQRPSAKVLLEQSAGAAKASGPVVDAMHAIKRIGLDIREALLRGDLRRFGQLLDEHWHTKRQISPYVSSEWLDDCYAEARDAGALGGKIIGAGGGGFFLFYCEGSKRELRERMAQRDLRELTFRFDFDGSRVMGNFGETGTVGLVQPSLAMEEK